MGENFAASAKEMEGRIGKDLIKRSTKKRLLWDLNNLF